MSEVIDAIKIWQQQNAPTIKGLDVAKQNAISQALNFFNKKFGGEGELMPIIEEKVIVEPPITASPNKGIPLTSIEILYGYDTFTFNTFESAQTWIQDRYNFVEMKQPFYIDCLLTWEDGSQVLTKNKIRVNENEEDSFNPNMDKLNKWLFVMFVSTISNWIEVNAKSYFTAWDWQIDETPKVESVNIFKVGDKVRLIKDIDKKSYPNNQELELGDIGIVKNKEGYLDQYDVEFNGKEIYEDSSYFELVRETSKVETAINQQIMIPQGTEFELMSDVGSKLKKGDTGVFAVDYIPPNTFLDAYMNSEARPDVIYTIPFKKIRIIEEAPTEELNQAEEEIVFADLEALENEIESINFEELEKLDKELDDLF